MRLRAAEFHITDPAQPFLDDKLDREKSALVLTDVLANAEGSFVLSLDAGWGQGKTAFIQMWAAHLRNQGFRCLIFNAWENDFAEDPLISFMGEMRAAIDVGLDGDRQATALRAWEKAKTVGGRLLGTLGPAAAKLATAGFLDLNELAEAIASDAVGRVIESEIDHYKESKLALGEFRTAISEFAGSIDGGNGRPLVVFVDELDRCRPTYAVLLLERIKHLFSVEHIVFVLAINKEQLRHSIAALYGSGIDGNVYLRRFVDLEYLLPEPSARQYSDYLMEKFGLAERFAKRPSEHDRDQFLETFAAMAQAYGLSLRDQEQCFARAAIILSTMRNNERIFAVLFAFLVVVRSAKPTLYREIMERRTTANEVIADAGWGGFRGTPYGYALQGYLEVGLDPNGWEAVFTRYEKQLNSGTQEPQVRRRLTIIRGVANEASEIRGPILDYLASRIEIGQRFHIE